ncbi:hypothetical protein [Agromyces laixinhei]|uniref:hypothetical protein n=1 Tax=Agromyces laixinhei TaxID=2585717 RepID=UPI001116A244|nr:hypothetical protein [Agromyces laixinhei]
MPDANSRRRRPRRGLEAVSLAAVVTLGGSGCAGGLLPSVCSTIGYLKQVDVVLSGPDAASADLIVLCAELGCSTPAAVAMTPPPSGPLWFATDLGEGHWRVDLDLYAPENVTIEVLGADGSTLTKTAEELDWRRTGGSEQCGGPMETDPIRVELE